RQQTVPFRGRGRGCGWRHPDRRRQLGLGLIKRPEISETLPEKVMGTWLIALHLYRLAEYGNGVRKPLQVKERHAVVIRRSIRRFIESYRLLKTGIGPGYVFELEILTAHLIKSIRKVGIELDSVFKLVDGSLGVSILSLLDTCVIEIESGLGYARQVRID